jgi:hypothetical protein
VYAYVDGDWDGEEDTSIFLKGMRMVLILWRKAEQGTH